MPRIQPVDPACAHPASKDLFASIQGALGGVPAMFRTVGQSPAALRAMWGFFAAMEQSSLPASLREQIALAVGQANDCGYCLAAHSALGARAGLSQGDLLAARRGGAADPKAAAALTFASAVLRHKGHVSDEDLASVRRAGYSDAQVLEILSAVVQNVYTNWTNHVARTAVDFPAAAKLD